MTLTPDPLDRMLVDLAARADLHQAPDRVPAIHRRARRAATVRAFTVAAAVTAVAVGVAVVVGAGGLGFTRGSMPAHRTPRPTAPSLTVDLARDDAVESQLPPSPLGIRAVVRVTLRGHVPQMSDAGGRPATIATDNLLELTMNWGDESSSGGNPQTHCVPGAPLVTVDTPFEMDHEYQRPGTYTITFQTGACDPVGRVTKTLTLTVG